MFVFIQKSVWFLFILIMGGECGSFVLVVFSVAILEKVGGGGGGQVRNDPSNMGMYIVYKHSCLL